MLLFAAAAIFAAQPGPHSAVTGSSRLTAVATATVRIVSGARIMSGGYPPDAHIQDVQLTGADGQTATAKLVEFE